MWDRLSLFFIQIIKFFVFFIACGNFSVQYNFQAIAVALLIMSQSQCTSTDVDCKDGEQAEWVHSSATATVFIGAIIGQLVVS